MKLLKLWILTLLAVGMAACSSGTSGWDDPSSPIDKFIAEYFPNEAYTQTLNNDGTTNVALRNGPTIVFDSNQWVKVDGNGNTLPEQFIFDCLPADLVDYLSELEVTAQVYSVNRTPTEYRITLSNSYITYDIATKAITGPITP